MESSSTGQAAGSFDQSDGLTIRSAVGDPTSEPHSNPPQSPKAHAKQSSISKLVAAQVQPQKQSSKSSKSKENSVSAKATPATAMDGPLPAFIIKRNELFDKLKREYQA